ncbi:hypothetical protein [Achromobacter spanius]|uniref:SMODS and SLOG-associating 2TM effector domain-containing protein n=1 Tax=Achromobacter spanius TaxID=217203 RepID=A0AAW3HZI1_9BURK|nr:hypothetical protein [Achromobacter spanius]KNE25258.1 hypothetical protein AFM18_23270 [Achromobacter spanius]
MKWSIVRTIYSIMGGVSLYFAGTHKEKFISGTNVDVDLSYWATVATFLALLIAIAEIVHSAHATKSLQAMVVQTLARRGAIDQHAAKGDCLNLLAQVREGVKNKLYDSAYKNFEEFRRMRRMVLSPSDLATEQKEWDAITNVLDVATIADSTALTLDGRQQSTCLKQLRTLTSKIEREARPET